MKKNTVLLGLAPMLVMGFAVGCSNSEERADRDLPAQEPVAQEGAAEPWEETATVDGFESREEPAVVADAAPMVVVPETADAQGAPLGERTNEAAGATGVETRDDAATNQPENLGAASAGRGR